ncbi:MAG: CHASE2 domain-containing protein [Magnetococcales bacterium]|nr:CHASE2 domain-containing protein [Magnetococcales bacterium]
MDAEPTSRPFAAPEKDPEGTGTGWNRWLWWLRAVALLLLALLVTLQGVDPKPLAEFRLRVFDFYQRLYPRVSDIVQVVIIDIDERSLDHYGQWPWPRTRLAEIVARLKDMGAAGVGFNFVFPGRDLHSPHVMADNVPDLDEKSRQGLYALTDTDTVFAQSMVGVPVVLGQMVRYGIRAPAAVADPAQKSSIASMGGDALPFLADVDGLIPNHAPLEVAAAGKGLLYVHPESDGIVRRVPMVVGMGQSIQPTFTLEALRVATGRRGTVVVVDPQQRIKGILIGGAPIPTDAQGQIWIHYEAINPARYLSAVDLLEGRLAAELIQGRMVLIGSSAAGLQDIHATPTEGTLSGVEIQAQVLETLLQGALLDRPDRARQMEQTLTAVMGLLLVALVPRLGVRLAFVLMLLLTVSCGAAGVYAFRVHGLLLDPVYAIGSNLLLLLFLGYQTLRRAELQRRLAQAARLEWEKITEVLEEQVQERTRLLLISQNKLEKLVELGIALSTEQEMDRLLQRILQGGREISQADMATLFVRTEEESLQFAYRSSSDSLPVKSIPLYDPVSGAANHQYVSVHAALTGKTIVLDDIYGNPGPYDVSGTLQFDAATNYRTQSMLALPLKTRDGQVLGVLQLINALDPNTGHVVPFDADLLGFLESLASKGAMALHNLRLIQAQEGLFESIIKVLATSIDAKSPYTGGHCARVPELARLLAEAACNATSGPFSSFSMDKDAWKAFHLAGWLHDCGKITTPEYVVDKSTKLETIYNRIHEIRMRFEVLYRDALIDSLQALQEESANVQQVQENLEAQLATLREEFAFIAQCNLGGEFMNPESVERLQRIASRSWQRHFSDRLGLSYAEQQRLQGVPEPSLPVVESLLADKPEHIVPRENHHPSHGRKPFKVVVPEHLYNYGEIYNLGIGRGTLTNEERFKINEHIIQGIFMLENLSLPSSLRGVVEMAGAHHETMIGTGYPYGLHREEMSVQARILAIADIFEALTAADRPYKSPKTLNQALRIMNDMRKDQHIDSDLFDLFLTSGVYKTYADMYLSPENCDVVEIRNYLKAV